jgi:hypothetical protein
MERGEACADTATLRPGKVTGGERERVEQQKL